MHFPLPIRLCKARASWLALLGLTLLSGLLHLLQPPAAHAQHTPTQADEPKIAGGVEAVEANAQAGSTLSPRGGQPSTRAA